MTQDVEKRTFNTPIRERWNPFIYHCLKAVDYHNELYFKSKDPWHLEKAQEIRDQLHELKTWIHRKEEKN